MQQYLQLLKDIKEHGTVKPAARENMPSSLSLFGYQFRHNLAHGFPLLTTKKMFIKGVIFELLWFLKGDTNIKYLIDNGVNIWNEDSYQYYLKIFAKRTDGNVTPLTFKRFVEIIKTSPDNGSLSNWFSNDDVYYLGDCGFQYGRVWRNWQGMDLANSNELGLGIVQGVPFVVDQISNLIEGLRKNPEGRRHMVTALDPAHTHDLALFPCHSMFQFNCRPLADNERANQYYAIMQGEGDRQVGKYATEDINSFFLTDEEKQFCDSLNIPKYHLDCQLYQRSADVFLGVPFNIASYSLLTHIIAKMCNMVAGEFIHTFGDVHMYSNHENAVNEQLSRTPSNLPHLVINECPVIEWNKTTIDHLLKSIEGFELTTFEIKNYYPQSAIKAELSTGLK